MINTKWAYIRCMLGCIAIGCSPVQSVYLNRAYQQLKGENNLKHISIATWADAQTPDLANLLLAITTDLVKLHSNYLVHNSTVVQEHWRNACTEDIDGVLVIRIADTAMHNNMLQLRMVGQLQHCASQQLIWQATAKSSEYMHGQNLAELVYHYSQQQPLSGPNFAGPIFILLQALLQSLPNPVLNDSDILEKIQLGQAF